MSKKKRNEKGKKNKLYTFLVILAIIAAFITGSIFGPALDQMITTFSNWKHERTYANGLIFVPLDESVYGKGGKSEDKAVVAYFDTEIHADNLYVGRTLKTTIEVGNGSSYPSRLIFETEGPVSVKVDEEKAEGKEVIIPPHKKGKIPIIITAPYKAFDEPVITYLKLNQEPVHEEDKNIAQQLLPGATIPVYTPQIAPPLKPLELLTESEFNQLNDDQRVLYGLSVGMTYDDFSFSLLDKIIAMISYQYSKLMFHTSGYLNLISIAIGVFIIILVIYFIYRKVGRRKVDEKFSKEFEGNLEL